jgi:hypothetical protein
MGVQKVTHEVRLQKWSRIVKECRNSGKTIKVCCAENNINVKTYYHWQKLVCQKACQELAITQRKNPETVPVNSSPVFAELNVPNHPAGKVAVTIQRNDTQIHIYGGADAATVETALLALRNLC